MLNDSDESRKLVTGRCPGVSAPQATMTRRRVKVCLVPADPLKPRELHNSGIPGACDTFRALRLLPT